MPEERDLLKIYQAAVADLPLTIDQLLAEMSAEDIEEVRRGLIGAKTLRAFAELIAEEIQGKALRAAPWNE